MIALPPGPYSVILADPPWWYNDRRNSHTRFSGGARRHYPLMKTDAICDLPIRTIAAANAMLWLWATWPCLPDAMRVMAAWGFRYRTVGFLWVKTNRNQQCKECLRNTPFFGIGWYPKSNTEMCLIGTRGRPWKHTNHLSQIVEAPRMEHSAKPPIVRRHIETFCGDVPRIELFARDARDGWDAWGNQLPEVAVA